MNSRTGSPQQTLTDQTADEAGRWDARLRAPDCTDADRALFAAWREADPAHRAAFEQSQTIVAALRHDRSRADVRALRDEALRVVNAHRRRRLAWAAVAAGVVAFGAGLAVWQTAAGDWIRAPLRDLAARLTGTEIYATGTGQRSTFTLEDGSTVELNAQSRIQVDYSESQRSIELIEGQALFNVAKNPRRPFVVRAGNRNIVAVGTQFDVRLDDRSVQVTLLEGKVRIERQDEGNVSTDTNPVSGSDEILLTPGKQLLAKLNSPLAVDRSERHSNAGGESLPGEKPAQWDGEVSVRDIDVTKVTGWRDGRIFLDDLPLTEAVAEMNKHSTVQITVADPALAQLRVNGMFKAGEQEAFVTALEDYFPIAVQHRGRQEMVLTARR